MASSPADQYYYPPSQPDPTIDFRGYYDRNKAIGTVGESVGTKNGVETYLPEEAQRRFFSLSKIRQVRRMLYPDVRGPDAVPAQYLQGDYRQVFATLLYLGKGNTVHRFLSNLDLQDSHLPFRQKPVDFPGSDEEFEQFFDAQWRFCAPIMKYRQSVDWHPRQILPFECLQKVGEGSTGKAWLIKVHKSHDQIATTASPATSKRTRSAPQASHPDDLDDSHLYVLKRFRPKHKVKEQLEEAKAHVAVRMDEKLTKDDGVVRFHGGFSHGSTFSILLEWASMGNLEQFFRTQERPTGPRDILDLLTSYVRLLTTLHCLRAMDLDGTVYQMCHFDIKPNNILIFPGESGRPYDLRLKLGDLGSSTSCPLLDDGDTLVLQKPGTRTYGAPECCRSNPLSESNLPLNYVSPNADLWSYGCVGSELATWIVRGWGGLEAYRDARKDNHEDPAFEDTDCFHNGIQTIRAVDRHHRRLIHTHPSDAIGAIVGLIHEHMLGPEAKHRTDPKEVAYRAREALHAVETSLPAGGATKEVDHHSPPEQSTSQRATFPTSSLEPSIAETAMRQLVRDAVKLQPVSYAQSSNNHPFSNAESPVRSKPHRSFSATQPLETNHREQVRARGPRASVPVNMRAAYKEHAQNNMSAARPMDERSTYYDPYRSGYHHNGEPSMSPQSPVTQKRRTHPRDGLMLADLTSTPNFVSEEPDSYEEQSDDSPSPNQHAEKPMDFGGRLASGSLHETSTGSTTKPTIPFLKVHEAILWKDSSKQPSRLSKMLGKSSKDQNANWRHLSSDFEDRDFVLLVDDSSSMRSHWGDVEQCAGLLAFCTTPYDKDGIDLKFMISEDKKNADDFDSITKRVRKNEPPSAESKHAQTANINGVLDSILGKYGDRINSAYGSRRRQSHLFSPTSRVKKLILFVLTNGQWGQHSDTKEPIRVLVDVLKKCNRPGNQIGIQFIRFGNDGNGKERLAQLDDFLQPDVVDVEAYPDGNFFKMLLGSINKDYDYSENPNSLSSRSDSPPASESAMSSPRTSEGQVMKSTPPPPTHYALASHTRSRSEAEAREPQRRKHHNHHHLSGFGPGG